MPKTVLRIFAGALLLAWSGLSIVQASSSNADAAPANTTSNGRYFVCTDADGAKSFQERPCAAGNNSEVRHYDKAPAVSSGERLSTSSPAYQNLLNSNRRLELQRHIRQGEQNLRSLEQRRSSELSSLRGKKQRANNNLAGAVWEQSISAEMQAVNSRYDALLRTEQQQLDRLRNEFNSLRPATQ